MELALFIAVVLLALSIILAYNQLIALRNNREQSFSDIDVQLKLRYDLVPNLVNAVKGYATHEKDLFENIAKLRTQAMGAQGVDEKVLIENQFTSVLKSIFAVSESYPELKANENFLQLQKQLADVENKIAASRRFFNHATKELNTVLMSFPVNVLNMIFRFKQGNFFEIGADEAVQKENVTVNI